MKNLDKIGVFLAGLGIFSRAILEWLRFFGVKPEKTQHWDFDWDEMILS